jgi:ERCC4-type nuclease
MNIEETALMICNMAYKLNKSSNKPPFYSISILKNTNATLNTDNEVDIDTDITNKAGLEQHYCNVVKKVKKDNITPENIGEIMLCQIPGISSTSAIAIMNKFKTIQNLIINLRENDKCLQDISYSNSKGQQRKVNKTVISNIIKFLKN